MLLQDVISEASFRHARAPNTLRNYAAALRRLAVHGVTRSSEATPEAVGAYVEARLADHKATSVLVEVSALLALLDHLATTGRYPPALLAAVRLCAPRLPRRQQLCAAYLSAPDVARYCAAAPSGVAWLVRLACLTGLRASELAALEWGDVDMLRRTIAVRGGKTGGRVVPLCTPALDLLRQRVPQPGLVFRGAYGKALGERVRRCQVPGLHVTLTLCRHTRASWWVQAGVPLAKVAKWLGHSVEVCARHYAGLTDTYDPAAEMGAAG